MYITLEFAICTKTMELLKLTTILLNQVGIYYGQIFNKY